MREVIGRISLRWALAAVTAVVLAGCNSGLSGLLGTTLQTVAPTFSLEPGEYPRDIQVELISETPGATIYFTTDGTDPAAGAVYDQPIQLSGDGAEADIRAYAVADGRQPSGETQGEFSIAYPLVTLESAGNGTVAFVDGGGTGPRAIAAESSVEIEATPAAGYQLQAWSVVDGDADAVTIDDSAAPVTSLTLGETNVTVQASFADEAAPAAPVIAGVTDGQITNAEQVTFALDGVDGEVDTIEYSIDAGGQWLPYTSPVTLTDEGTYLITARQSDVSGNESPDASPVEVTIDRTPPDTPTVTGPGPIANNTPRWQWTPGGGGSGVFRVKLNDNDLSTDAITISETSYTPADPLPDGAATLYIQERDEAGNWSGTASGNAEVDTTAPAPVGNLTAETEVGAVTLTWDDPPDADGDLHEIVITWTPVEGDPQPKSIAIGTGSATISGLTNVADYTFTVSAADTLGNAASETVTAVVALGLVKWSASAGENFYGGAALGPNGSIYVADLGGVVYAFDPDDGSELEQWDLGLGVETAPVIAGDGTIYVAAGPSSTGTLFALNPNGTIDASYDIDAPLVASPAIASDGTVYLAAGDGNVYLFDPDLTLVDTLSTEATRIESSPSIGNNGTVYVGADDGKVYAFNADPTDEWPFTAADQIHSAPAIAADGTIYVATFDNTVTVDSGQENFLYAINPDGTLQWDLSLPDPVDSSPVLGPDGTIYLSMWAGDLFAVDPNGDVKWTFPDGTFSTGTRNSTPAVGADGTVYVGMDGVYAVNPDGTLKWRYLSSASFGSFDSPILIGEDGTVYGGNFDKTFFAIYGESGGPADSAWPMYGQNARRTGVAP